MAGGGDTHLEPFLSVLNLESRQVLCGVCLRGRERGGEREGEEEEEEEVIMHLPDVPTFCLSEKASWTRSVTPNSSSISSRRRAYTRPGFCRLHL